MFGLIEYFILYAFARAAEWFFFSRETKEKVDVKSVAHHVMREWVEEDGSIKMVVKNYSTHALRVLLLKTEGLRVKPDAIMKATNGNVMNFSGGKIIAPGETIVLYSATFAPVARYEEALVTWHNLVVQLRRAYNLKIIYENQNVVVMPGWDENPPSWPVHVPQCFIRGTNRLIVPSRMANETIIRDVGSLLDGKDFKTWLHVTKQDSELPKVISELGCVGDLRFLKKNDVEFYEQWRVYYLRAENPCVEEK